MGASFASDVHLAACACPADPLKYFGCDLGAQINFDKATGTSIVNGAHDGKKLSELLEVCVRVCHETWSTGGCLLLCF